MAQVLNILCGFGVDEIAECVCQRAGGDRETNFTGQEGAGGIEKTIQSPPMRGFSPGG